MKVGKCQQKEVGKKKGGGKKGMKSGNPRHIFIEKREKKSKPKRDKDELTLGFSPITYYPMKHIG